MPRLRRLLTSPFLWGGLFVFTGVLHFVAPGGFERIVPPPIPPEAAVRLSGAAEVAGGIGLMLRRTRRAAAWGLLALLVAVFPANVYAALRPETLVSVPAWALWARLPLQPLLGWLVWRAGGRRGRDRAAEMPGRAR